jgi:putative transposase
MTHGSRFGVRPLAESFFAILECELLDRRRFRSQAEARMAVFHFIEGFYVEAWT